MKCTRIFPALVMLLFLFGGSAHAARLYYDVPEVVPYGETFLVPLRIDVEGECINAVDVTLTYSDDVLFAVEFSIGDSLLSLWPEPPAIDSGSSLITFAGGIPGGYCGLVSGDRGRADVLGTLVLRALPNDGPFEAVREGVLGFLVDPSVLLHDGFGTSAAVTAESASFSIREVGELPVDAWAQLLVDDTILPEKFMLTITVNPLVLDGASYVVFSTTDKQSGIDYYEVREADAAGYVPGTRMSATWVRWNAGTPYELHDTDKASTVSVRAVDKAGNVRLVTFRRIGGPVQDVATRLEVLLLAGIAVAIAILILAMAWAIRRRKDLEDAQRAA